MLKIVILLKWEEQDSYKIKNYKLVIQSSGIYVNVILQKTNPISHINLEESLIPSRPSYFLPKEDLSQNIFHWC